MKIKKRNWGKLFSIFSVASIAASGLGLTALNNVDNSKQVKLNADSEAAIENYQYFEDYIKSIYKNNCPTLDISRGAAIPNELSFTETIAQLELQKENGISDVRDSIFMYLPNDKYTAYNVNALSQFTTNNNGLYLDSINSSNINKLNFFNNEEKGAVNDINNIPLWIDHIKKVTGANQIDFVCEEIVFHALLVFALQNPTNSLLEYVIKNSNKIILTTDGAWHARDFVPYLIDVLDGNVVDKAATETGLENIKNGTGHLTVKLIKDLLQIKDFTVNGQNYSDFIHFISYDSSFIANLNYLYNITSFDTNFTDYKKIFATTSIGDEFTHLFAKVFLKDSSLSNIFVNNVEAYDPSKKNLIFIGSSLFKPKNEFASDSKLSRLEDMPNLQQEVQKTIFSILNNFDLSQYNIIWKLHPVFTNQNAINYVKLITNNKIQKPIIVNPKIPFEVLLANDYYEYQNNTGNNFIFKGSDSNEAMHHTTLFGLQATTTTIHVTRKFYQSTFGLNKFQVADLISFKYFPIPDAFPIVSRLNEDNVTNTSYFDANVDEIKGIYKWWCISILKNDPSLKDKDYFILNDLHKVTFDVSSANVPLIVSLSIVALVIVILAITFVVINKKRMLREISWISNK